MNESFAEIQHVPVAALPWERFKEVLEADQAEALERTVTRAQRLLGGRVVWNINSTARGGGVAEMLTSLIAYTRGAGVDARWVVIEGAPEFYRVTKRIHNRLHGAAGDGGPLGRGRARGVPRDDGPQRAGDGSARTTGRHRCAPRPPDGWPCRTAAGSRRCASCGAAMWGWTFQTTGRERPGAFCSASCGTRRPTSSRGPPTVGRPRPEPTGGHLAVDRRIRAEEPGPRRAAPCTPFSGAPGSRRANAFRARLRAPGRHSRPC